MSSLCGLYLCIATVLLLGVASLATDSPPIQDAADRPQKAAQSSDNNCVNYNLVDATRNTDYFYTCCETLGEGTAKIDAKTKVTIHNYDCNPSHLTTTDYNQQQMFQCTDKGNAEKWCNQRWGWLSTDDCWVWSECFEAACRPGSSEGSFCGDGRCDDSVETSNSCPLDCCPVVNPDQCIIKNNTCSSLCCSEATCCDGSEASTSAEVTTFWLIVGAVIAGVVCLLYCCCCCCCCCCRHLYKSMFHHSKKRRHGSFIVSGAV
ncbi:uncharacterized protein LOC117298055 [Asterias rubens]|uniref:uncharacterized protein LOC117298055 n=1 Tax=Asterias rubens TaxID=7604 RepID=UPI0014554D3C|nr:uncharacterized protein LOC117298055 [Asterias rubens]